jgi:hypothetical protein
MSVVNRIYPNQTTIDSYPILSELRELGIIESLSWSLTELGPHFHFEFSELRHKILSETINLNSTPKIQIGMFSKEWPFGKTYYDITMDDMGLIWMDPRVQTECISPIFLASSPKTLSDIIDRFTDHIKSLSKSNQTQEWEADWRLFLDDCIKIDPQGGTTYWASLAIDYLENE